MVSPSSADDLEPAVEFTDVMTEDGGAVDVKIDADEAESDVNTTEDCDPALDVRKMAE